MAERFRCRPSSLYTFPAADRAWLGIAIPQVPPNLSGSAPAVSRQGTQVCIKSVASTDSATPALRASYSTGGTACQVRCGTGSGTPARPALRPGVPAVRSRRPVAGVHHFDAIDAAFTARLHRRRSRGRLLWNAVYLVPEARLELARPKSGDFESPASTNSATRAREFSYPCRAGRSTSVAPVQALARQPQVRPVRKAEQRIRKAGRIAERYRNSCVTTNGKLEDTISAAPATTVMARAGQPRKRVQSITQSAMQTSASSDPKISPCLAGSQ